MILLFIRISQKYEVKSEINPAIHVHELCIMTVSKLKKKILINTSTFFQLAHLTQSTLTQNSYEMTVFHMQTNSVESIQKQPQY